MTHHTDAARAAFEAWARDQYPSIDLTRDGDDYSKSLAKDYWSLWQAARRAPAAPVPKGWKPVPVELLERIQESLGSLVSDQGWSQSDMDTADALDGLLAAAPQPPEAAQSNSAEFDGIEKAVAPVQLPEPDAWRYTDARGHYRYRGARPGFAVEYPILKPEALYTEQQVRELLAAHDIQERST